MTNTALQETAPDTLQYPWQPQQLERKSVTILAADVVGFAKLVADAEEDVFTRLRTLRIRIIDPAIQAENGRVVKTMGDGLLVEFPTPAAGIRAALTVQRQVDSHDEQHPDALRIRFRIGINHGSVIIDGEDVLGDVVNIAARLETLAAPGGICISRAVRDMLDGEMSAQASSQGMQYVRNIPNPVEVWKFETGVADKALTLQQQRSDRPSVLVLPFDNRSPSPEDGFFADGITDDVISALSRFRSLFVIARGSSLKYKGKDPDISQIAQDTGVRYVVGGSCRRAGTRLRVSAQLISADTGRLIWSDKFDREIENIFDLQDEITASIAGRLSPEIGAHERSIARSKPTESMSAWELCQRGLAETDHRTNQSILNAFEFFHRAIETDPAYALPHALLGRLHALMIYSGRSKDPGTNIAKGMKHATLAVQIDDRLETGHMALALLLLIQRREADAREALARAKALNDNEVHIYNAQTYINLFQPEPDTVEMEKAGLEAVRLSPNDPLMWSYYWMLVMAVWLRDMELGENVLHYLKPASSFPNAEAFVHVAVGVVAVKRGDHEGAKQAVGKALKARPQLTLDIIRNSFHFPKWPVLVDAISAELKVLVALGLPKTKEG